MMRMLTAVVLAASVAGCSATECPGIGDKIEAAVDKPQACTVDSDCTFQVLNCGLPHGCGAIVSTTTKAALVPLLNDWGRWSCGDNSKCQPCPMPLQITCTSAGFCQTF
jgi:hypothetical protein